MSELQAGSLRRRITIQKPVEVRDAAGGFTPSWADVAKNIPAAIESVNGREYFSAVQIQSDITTVITIRWRPQVIDATMRVTHYLDNTETGFEVYNIESVLPDMTGRSFIKLMCRRRDAQGYRADG